MDNLGEWDDRIESVRCSFFDTNQVTLYEYADYAGRSVELNDVAAVDCENLAELTLDL